MKINIKARITSPNRTVTAPVRRIKLFYKIAPELFLKMENVTYLRYIG
jgi:hypothetical protein